MASASLALGSILGTVASLANSVGQVANTVTTSVSALNDFAVDARDKAEERRALHRAQYSDSLIDELNMERSERKLRIEEFRSQSDAHAHHFDEGRAIFEAALTEYRERKANRR